jgi:hypothetical protein
MFEIDQVRGVVTLYGIEYSLEFFKMLSIASPGTWFRVAERSNGTLILNMVDEKTERCFDAISGKGRAYR